MEQAGVIREPTKTGRVEFALYRTTPGEKLSLPAEPEPGAITPDLGREQLDGTKQLRPG